MKLNDKLDKLETLLKSYGKITVALSGGVDSAFLLAFSCKVLGAEKVRAITACGPHLAADETEYAGKLCEALGVQHESVSMNHIMPILKPNPVDRCYHCKKAMFSELLNKTATEQDDESSKSYCDSSYTDYKFVLADGTNLDDMNDYRPGHKALAELKIASPLKEAGLTKSEIRAALHQLAAGAKETKHIGTSSPSPANGVINTCVLADALTLPDGMPIWEKPAFACLASRIPYGETITEEKLHAVYKAETFLRSLGLKQVRVRHHGDIARIEAPAEECAKLFDELLIKQAGERLDVQSGKYPETAREMINDHLKSLGFKYVTLDLGGYKMGGGFHNGQE